MESLLQVILMEGGFVTETSEGVKEAGKGRQEAVQRQTRVPCRQTSAWGALRGTGPTEHPTLRLEGGTSAPGINQSLAAGCPRVGEVAILAFPVEVTLVAPTTRAVLWKYWQPVFPAQG